jgi:hypothetical protein
MARRIGNHRVDLTRVAVGVVLPVLIVGLIITVGWRLTGGSWRVVDTASMGAAAPVGTLLWVRPVPFAALKVGQFISFHPPAEPHATFSHRIVAVNPDGSLSTRGDINGAVDPWHLRAANVIGRVQTRWWDVGWLIKALPIVLVGAVAVFVLVHWLVGRAWRVPAAWMGLAVVVSVAIYRIRPLVRASLISFTSTPDGARADIVGTGILPLRVTGSGGSSTQLYAGHVGSVLARQSDGHGLYSIRVAAHLPLVWIVVGALIVFSPVLYGLLVGYRPRPEAAVA